MDIDMAIKAFQDANIIGSFRIIKDKEQRKKQDELIDQIKYLKQEIRKLRKEIKKETQFNKKVELNMKLQQLKQKLEDLQSNLLH